MENAVCIIIDRIWIFFVSFVRGWWIHQLNTWMYMNVNVRICLGPDVSDT